eukprot:3969278-Pyramimonas_sp.AAC.1
MSRRSTPPNAPPAGGRAAADEGIDDDDGEFSAKGGKRGKGRDPHDDPRSRPRGNLPPPPEFDGDMEDPKIFRRYKAQVENW